jgi:hypothetical protein
LPSSESCAGVWQPLDRRRRCSAFSCISGAAGAHSHASTCDDESEGPPSEDAGVHGAQVLFPVCVFAYLLWSWSASLMRGSKGHARVTADAPPSPLEHVQDFPGECSWLIFPVACTGCVHPCCRAWCDLKNAMQVMMLWLLAFWVLGYLALPSGLELFGVEREELTARGQACLLAWLILCFPCWGGPQALRFLLRDAQMGIGASSAQASMPGGLFRLWCICCWTWGSWVPRWASCGLACAPSDPGPWAGSGPGCGHCLAGWTLPWRVQHFPWWTLQLRAARCSPFVQAVLLLGWEHSPAHICCVYCMAVVMLFATD